MVTGEGVREDRATATGEMADRVNTGIELHVKDSESKLPDFMEGSGDPFVKAHDLPMMPHEPQIKLHDPLTQPLLNSHDSPLKSHDSSLNSTDMPTKSPDKIENAFEGLSSVQQLQMVMQNQPPPLIRDIDANDHAENSAKKQVLAAIVNRISQKGEGQRPTSSTVSDQPGSSDGRKRRGRKRKSPLPNPPQKRPRGRPKGSGRRKEGSGEHDKVMLPCTMSAGHAAMSIAIF